MSQHRKISVFLIHFSLSPFSKYAYESFWTKLLFQMILSNWNRNSASCWAKPSLDSLFKFNISNARNLTLITNVVVPSIFISLILSWAKADSAEVCSSSELPMIHWSWSVNLKIRLYLVKWFLYVNTKIIKCFKTG